MCKHQHLEMFGLKLKKHSHFHTLEVVGRGNETQLQEGDHFIYLI